MASVRNIRIALAVIFKEVPPPVIAERYNINLSRVYQITATIKQRYGWKDGMAPNAFSQRIAASHNMYRGYVLAHQQETPEQMFYTFVHEEQRDLETNWRRHPMEVDE